MRVAPFEEAVAIDTNVFLHLLNPRQNTGAHIHWLLMYLQSQGIALIVDTDDRIGREYKHHIGPVFSGTDDRSNEIFLLRYWYNFAQRQHVTVSGNDRLMAAIRQVITEPSEAVDRIFVYVAFTTGNELISNDRTHIVDGPVHGTGQRRRNLLRSTRRIRPNGADILTSEEAHAKIA